MLTKLDLPTFVYPTTATCGTPWVSSRQSTVRIGVHGLWSLTQLDRLTYAPRDPDRLAVSTPLPAALLPLRCRSLVARTCLRSARIAWGEGDARAVRADQTKLKCV